MFKKPSPENAPLNRNRNRPLARTRVRIAAALTLVAVFTPQAAHAISVGGGEWNYGADAVSVWSSYNHPTRTHMAWVRTLVDYQQTPPARPGLVAGISLRASLWGNQGGWGVY